MRKDLKQAIDSYPQLVKEGIDAYRKYQHVCHSIVENLRMDYCIDSLEVFFEEYIRNEAMVIEGEES